jgi:hypothetical protein
LTDEPIATLAHAARTATAHAGLLDGLGRAVVVHRKPLSELHWQKILWLNKRKSNSDSIDALLSAYREIA